MAELKEETVQELNKLLRKLAKDKDRESAASGRGRRDYGGGKAADASGEIRERMKYAQGLEEELELKEALAKADMRLAEAEAEAYRKSLDFNNVSKEQMEHLLALEKGLDKTTKGYAKAAEAQKKYSQEMAAGAKKMQNVQSALLGINGEFSQLTRTFLPTSITQLKGFAKSLFSVKGILGLVGSALLKIVSNTFNFIMSVDKATASMKKQLGMGKKFTGHIANITYAYGHLGVTADEAKQATVALVTGMTDFTKLGEAQRNELAGTATLLSEIGVSGQDTAAALDVMTRSLGYSAEDAHDVVLELVSIAHATGQVPAKVAKDFATVAPKLSFYGTEMINVFRKLESQSKATGLSMDQLLGISGEQFDTFEGSATAVGKMNALLGGPYLNSIDMLNASEGERLEMLKASMDASGTIFSDLNKFEQKAFASALGTDVDTLRRAMGGLTAEEKRQEITKKKLADRASEARSVMDKFKDAINGLVSQYGMKLLPIMHTVANKFVDFVGKVKSLEGGIVGFLKSKAKDLWEKKKGTLILIGIGIATIVFLSGRFITNLLRLPGALMKTLMPMRELTKEIGLQAAANAANQLAGGGGGGGGGGGFGQGDLMGEGRMGGGRGVKGGKWARAGRFAKSPAVLGAGLTVAGMGMNYAADKRRAAETDPNASGVKAAAGMSTAGYALSGAGMGLAIGSIIPGVGNALGAAIGGALGSGYGLWKNVFAGESSKIEDGAILRTPGGTPKVVKFDSKDNIEFRKPGGPLDRADALRVARQHHQPPPPPRGGDDSMTGLDAMKLHVADPIIEALNNMQVVFKIGEREFAGAVQSAQDSPTGRAANLPWGR